MLRPLMEANDRIRYVWQANAGGAAARNAGATLASSEYLYFIDDDDLAFPKGLVTLRSELEQHPAAAMACGEAVLFSGNPPEAPDMPGTTRTVDPRAFLRFNQIGSAGQALVRRAAFEAVGGFDARFWGTEDWDLWLRLLALAPARWVRVPVLAYRLHDNNMSRNIARMYLSSREVSERHTARLPHPERVLMRYLSHRALRGYHVPRLQKMLAEAVAQRQWGVAGSAARAWSAAWSTDIGASVALKAHLARHGKWRLEGMTDAS